MSGRGFSPGLRVPTAVIVTIPETPWIAFIRRALSVGFSLPELCSILKLHDDGGVPGHRVRALAQAKLAEVDEKIRELVAMRGQREQTLQVWDTKLANTRDGEQARLLEMLPPETTLLRKFALRSNKNKKEGHNEESNRLISNVRLDSVRAKSRRASLLDDQARRIEDETRRNDEAW
jgi:DNA-binding transcriptional MerR regulator